MARKKKWGLNEWGSLASIAGGVLGVLSIVVTLRPELLQKRS